MRARFPTLAILVILAAASQPAHAADAWFDWEWHYRFPAEFHADASNRTDWVVEQRVNFTQLLAQKDASLHLDPDSIRVIEYAQDGSVLAEATSQFDPDAPGSGAGELLWKVNGLVERGGTRTYYVYFDALENSRKPAPEYPREVIVRNREQDIRIDTEHLMIFTDRAKYGYTHIVEKHVPWMNVEDPPANDPLASSRENVTRFRGFLSGPGEHACDPGCEWTTGNTTASVVHDGPLRATIVSVSDTIIDKLTNETEQFTSTVVTQVYAGQHYYRMKKSYGFAETPKAVDGLNRRTWFYGYRAYAYPAATGVAEGTFPDSGTEFADWNGTWDDASDGSTGIADIELAPLGTPRSLWIERDGHGGISYMASVWRPGRIVSDGSASDTVHYFHDGDWRAGGVPEMYESLAFPPTILLGNLSTFLLNISAPDSILNWNPVLPLAARVEGNRTPVNVSCRVTSRETNQTFFDGTMQGGVDIFNLPAGGIRIACIADDAAGNSEFATAESTVYDVMPLAYACGASLAFAVLLLALFAYRVRQGLARAPHDGLPCPRCGMPLRTGARSCPVCSSRVRKLN